MTRSMLLALALGAVAVTGCMTQDEDTSSTAQDTGGFTCSNKFSIQGVGCVGSISVLPINVDIKNVGVLDNNKLSILSGDLNNVSVLDGGILNNDKILNDVEVTTLNDFLNKFVINVSKNDIDVCTTVLGVLLCK